MTVNRPARATDDRGSTTATLTAAGVDQPEDDDTPVEATSPTGSPPPSRDQKISVIAQSIFFLARKIQLLELGADVTMLTNAESLVLRHIDVNPGITPSKLSSDLGLRSGNTSAALRSLEAKGMVFKDAGETDRRRSHFRLTDAARADVARVQATWVKHLRPMLPPDADLDAALAVLTYLDDGLTN